MPEVRAETSAATAPCTRMRDRALACLICNSGPAFSGSPSKKSSTNEGSSSGNAGYASSLSKTLSSPKLVLLLLTTPKLIERVEVSVAVDAKVSSGFNSLPSL